MNLNELMMVKNFDATRVLVFRHCPYEPGLKKVLPWLAEDQPGLFNAYQQTQGEKLESAMKTLSGEGYVASFVGLEPGKAHFVGLYSIGAFRPLSLKEYWEVPAYAVLKSHGMVGFTEAEGRPSVLWFDLQPVDFYPTWKGKLVVSWPPPEILVATRTSKRNDGTFSLGRKRICTRHVGLGRNFPNLGRAWDSACTAEGELFPNGAVSITSLTFQMEKATWVQPMETAICLDGGSITRNLTR